MHSSSFPKPNGQYNGHASEEKPPLEPLTTVRVSSWHGLARPVREWLDGRNLFRVGYVSILTGPGAVGKTLVALQAAVACTAVLPWLGAPIKAGPVIFYSAEEPLEEMHIRCDEICEAEGLHLDRLSDFHIIDLNKMINAALIIQSDDRKAVVALTDLFHRLDLTIGLLKPICVWLDNRSLLVTGDENNRNLAAFSMRHLQLLAEKHNCAIILLAHPSNAGVNDGTGASGSTAWFNMARSVVYMTKPKAAEKDETVDPDARILTNNKPNYSKPDKQVNIKWQFYRFICTDPPIRADDGIGRQDKAEGVVLRLLKWHADRGMKVTRASAAKTFDKMPKPMREGFNMTWFEKGILGLLDQQKIRVVSGRKSGHMVEILEVVQV